MQIGIENFLGISEVYVVFEDADSLWWLRFLKKGFRHCYFLLTSREYNLMILLNPRSNRTDIQLFHNCDIVNTIRILTSAREDTILRVHLEQTPLKCAPIMFFTCVEFVKRILGIHDFSIITPYQLYKKLKIVGKKS